MTGDPGHNRSSSPLKRRASSMEPEEDTEMKGSAESTPAPEGNGNTAASNKTHFPRAMSVDLPQPGTGTGDTESTNKTTEHPPLQVQIKTIQTLLQAFNEEALKPGTKVFAVSKAWLGKALALGGDPKFAKAAVDQGPLGPVDNSDIIRDCLPLDNDLFVRLKPGVALEDLEFFPEDAWRLVQEWYGLEEGQAPITRTVVNTSPDSASPENVVYELHPPVFTIHRLWSHNSGISIDEKLKNAKPITLVKSVSAPYNEVFKEIKTKAGIPLDRKMRLHSIVPLPLGAGDTMEEDAGQEDAALTPPDSPGRNLSLDAPENWPELLVDVETFTKVDDSRRTKVDVVDQTGNANYNGKRPLSTVGLTQDLTLVIDEEVDKNDHVLTCSRRGANRVLASRGAGTQTRGANSGRNSPALSTHSGPVTRGRSNQKKKKTRNEGVVGLVNLGNSCYMNSALQCIRNVPELTKYFLTDVYEEEINTDNPLGYHGQVASMYGALLKDIHSTNKGSVSPAKFKNTIGRFRPTFAGWGQQDSQEFLGFLLDGLQEDLSRIKKKPYIEKPDSTDEMIGDEEAIKKMAEQVWDITRRRDDSVIADLFTGMYKSTLKCPECSKVSITFDPFNNLTLPIPIEDLWSRRIKFYPLSDIPVELELELPKHSAMELLRKAVAQRVGVPFECLIGAEEFKERFFKIYSDVDDVSEAIGANDVAAFHELEAAPTNWQKRPSAKYRSMLDVDDEEPFEDPRTERMVVPVFHRQQFKSADPEGAGIPPQFITLTREEAYNEDIIRRKVLEKVECLSTWEEFLSCDDDQVGGDGEVSSSDSKVMATSVESEEDTVRVSKNHPDGKEPTKLDGALRESTRPRPTWIDPSVFLPSALQNLFDMYYFDDNNELIPSGWSNDQYSSSLRKLSSRAPASADSQSDLDESNSPGASISGNNKGADSDADSSHQQNSDEDEAHSSFAATRMKDETSEEDEAVPVVRPAKANTRARRAHERPGPGGRKKTKPHKVYGKRGNKRRNRELKAERSMQSPYRHEVPPQPTPQDNCPGPLVRLGEAIVIDWHESAFDAVFGQTDENDGMRGAPTYHILETLQDPALEQRRQKRLARRTKGISLEECLDEFERAEVLSEQDTWYCPRCKEHRRASKKFDLWKSPDILVVHLKRFSSAGYRREKLDVLVDFPIEGLDLTRRVLHQETGKEEIYDLIGVDEHFGGMGGGHYTAVAKNFIDGQWYNFNDSSVSSCNATKAVSKAAYLLFYRRRSSNPLGGERFRDICAGFDQPSEAEDDDEEMADAGEGRRLGGGSSQTGSSRHGIGAGATRRGPDRGLASTTMSTRDDGEEGDDEDDPDEPPPYEASNSLVRRSIEGDDEGIGMGEGATYTTFQQNWNFAPLGNSNEGPANSPDADNYASDSAQVDSDTQDRDVSIPDADSTFADHADDELAGVKPIELWAQENQEEGVMSVPPTNDHGAISDVVTEIYLDDESEQQQQKNQAPPSPQV